jgi:hypothetical protein
MNALVGNWNGFSTFDRVAIRTVYPGPGVNLSPPPGQQSHIYSAGNYQWTMSAGSGGSGQYTYQWWRENMSTHPSGYLGKWIISTSPSVSVWIDESDQASFGPSFRLYARVIGLNGQISEQFVSITVSIN